MSTPSVPDFASSAELCNVPSFQRLLTDLNSAFVAFGVAPSRCIARQYTSDVCSAIDRFTSAEHINSQCQQMAEKLGGARLLWEFADFCLVSCVNGNSSDAMACTDLLGERLRGWLKSALPLPDLNEGDVDVQWNTLLRYAMLGRFYDIARYLTVSFPSSSVFPLVEALIWREQAATAALNDFNSAVSGNTVTDGELDHAIAMTNQQLSVVRRSFHQRVVEMFSSLKEARLQTLLKVLTVSSASSPAAHFTDVLCSKLILGERLQNETDGADLVLMARSCVLQCLDGVPSKSIDPALDSRIDDSLTEFERAMVALLGNTSDGAKLLLQTCDLMVKSLPLSAHLAAWLRRLFLHSAQNGQSIAASIGSNYIANYAAALVANDSGNIWKLSGNYYRATGLVGASEYIGKLTQRAINAITINQLDVDDRLLEIVRLLRNISELKSAAAFDAVKIVTSAMDIESSSTRWSSAVEIDSQVADSVRNICEARASALISRAQPVPMSCLFTSDVDTQAAVVRLLDHNTPYVSADAAPQQFVVDVARVCGCLVAEYQPSDSSHHASLHCQNAEDFGRHFEQLVSVVFTPEHSTQDEYAAVSSVRYSLARALVLSQHIHTNAWSAQVLKLAHAVVDAHPDQSDSMSDDSTAAFAFSAPDVWYPTASTRLSMASKWYLKAAAVHCDSGCNVSDVSQSAPQWAALARHVLHRFHPTFSSSSASVVVGGALTLPRCLAATQELSQNAANLLSVFDQFLLPVTSRPASHSSTELNALFACQDAARHLQIAADALTLLVQGRQQEGVSAVLCDAVRGCGIAAQSCFHIRSVRSASVPGTSSSALLYGTPANASISLAERALSADLGQSSASLSVHSNPSLAWLTSAVVLIHIARALTVSVIEPPQAGIGKSTASMLDLAYRLCHSTESSQTVCTALDRAELTHVVYETCGHLASQASVLL